jgi:dimethylaniline monooxygenase (N-oxide forming)
MKLSKTTKKVCVIGAGPSGLIATKELLDEGHDVYCFEKYSKLGGVFNFSDFKGGIRDSTKLTVSNYFMAYSCFPPKSEEKRKYWTFREYTEYLSAFVEHFKLGQHIQYNRKVISVKRQRDGKYAVIVENSDDPLQKVTYIFDAIAVCSGTHQIPRDIDIKGKEIFKGEICHSASYKNADEFKGKRVLCVGIGESGADITHHIAQVAKQCFLSIRQYQAIVERFPLGREYPNDAFTSYALYSIPTTMQNVLVNLQLATMEKFSKNKEVVAYAKWNRKAGNFFNHFFTKNEIFFKSIAEGKLEVNTSGIDHLEANHVVFKDGSKLEVDVIMLNTGYVDQFAFIKDAEINNIRQMYKHMVHPELGADIVFIGWARPGVGGVPACSEMQSRYFSLLCSNELQLPEKTELGVLTDKQANFEEQIYHKNPTLHTLVHYSTFMHDFAKTIGCSPWRTATFLNPKLLYKIWFGSQLPNIYRLYGPHNNPEQAKAVVYKLAIAINPVEQIVYLLFTSVSAILARFGIIKADPIY